MELFIVIAVFSLILGIMFLFAPEFLRALNEASSRRVANLEQRAFIYRVGTGLSLVIASLLFFFVAYYIWAKG